MEIITTEEARAKLKGLTGEDDGDKTDEEVLEELYALTGKLYIAVRSFGVTRRELN